MSAGVPRAVLVTRPSDYEALLHRHGTPQQARFFLESRGQSMDAVEERHRAQEAAVQRVSQAIPSKWRRARAGRHDLAQFLFEPDDLVIAVGQDGLVANLAKYLEGQPVLGINPDARWYDGILVRHPAERARELLQAAAQRHCRFEERTMVEASLDNGQTLRALNEVFVGHRTHQSARYRLNAGQREERQSSSGVIVTTGTGATGWARSITRQLGGDVELPHPGDAWLTYLVREAFPSRSSGTELCRGRVDADSPLAVISEMNEGGAVFGDGIEDDRLDFGWGMRLSVRVAPVTLRLIAGRGRE